MVLTTLLATLASCGPPAGIFQVISASSPRRVRTFAVDDGLTTSGDPVVLGAVASDVGSVQYMLNDRRRAYLFDGDLRTGISSGSFLHLPLNVVGTPIRTVDITPFDSTKWRSFRVYDAGLCSAVAGFTGASGTLMVPSIGPTIVAAFDGALAGNAVCNRRFFRIARATVEPVLRASSTSGGFETASDRVRFSSVYRAQSIGLAGSECSPVRLTLSVEFGFRPVPGTLSHAPGCAAADTTSVPGTTDFEGVIDPDGISAHVQGFCSTGGAIEGSVRDALTAQLPELVRVAVRNALLQQPSLFGLTSHDTTACRCPEDCDSRARGGSAWPLWGARHSCIPPGPTSDLGVCGVQLEAHRINMRPEGVEIVLTEDASEPQYSIYSLTPTGPTVRSVLCAGGNDAHNAVPSSHAPLPGTHLVFTDTTFFPDTNRCL